VSRLCEFYPGICLTTEEKAGKNLSQVKKTLNQSTVHILPKQIKNLTQNFFTAEPNNYVIKIIFSSLFDVVSNL
jgi:hypothetical protein